VDVDNSLVIGGELSSMAIVWHLGWYYVILCRDTLVVPRAAGLS